MHSANQKEDHMTRSGGRKANQLRELSFEPGFTANAEGSVLISMGNTRVLCTATVEEGVPRWMINDEKEGGWVTGEYSMLPRATTTRTRRERSGAKGRTQEIQRLIGRSLRAAVDLTKIGPRTITIDCDVLQADGGTRTASITGGYVALLLGLKNEINSGAIDKAAFRSPVAAISAGIIGGEALLDLNYEEDVSADVDANFVMNGQGEIVEIQGTAEGETMSKASFDAMFEIAAEGIANLVEGQKKLLESEGVILG